MRLGSGRRPLQTGAALDHSDHTKAAHYNDVTNCLSHHQKKVNLEGTSSRKGKSTHERKFHGRPQKRAGLKQPVDNTTPDVELSLSPSGSRDSYRRYYACSLARRRGIARRLGLGMLAPSEGTVVPRASVSYTDGWTTLTE